MSRCALFDDSGRGDFLPFTHSRPLSEMRFGILTLRGKWEELFGWEASHLTLPYLRDKFPFPNDLPEYLINARLIPGTAVLNNLSKLHERQALTFGNELLALRIGGIKREELLSAFDERGSEGLKELAENELPIDTDPEFLEKRWDLFARNGEALKADHAHLKENKRSEPPSSSNTVIGDDLFIGEGAHVEHAILNTETGPIHIDAEAEVMEGAMIRGPFYLGPHGVVKMGAKIYGSTTVGPYGKVGGEINNCVIFGYSNKAHDGFLGNSVIGEWCNLGADTNNSNLKNNYGPVKVWDYQEGGFTDSGLTFCGIFMGDHSKCGIDTMFNTGTTIGFSANVFDAGFPPKFIPSFFWGGSGGGEAFELVKAKEVAAKMRERRGLPFDDAEEGIFDSVHEASAEEWKASE